MDWRAGSDATEWLRKGVEGCMSEFPHCPKCRKPDAVTCEGIHRYKCEDCGWKWAVMPGTKRHKEWKAEAEMVREERMVTQW